MAPNPNLRRLREAGVSIWLDALSREMLERLWFAELIDDYGVTGATFNPTIFAKPSTGSDRYDSQLRTCRRPTLSTCETAQPGSDRQVLRARKQKKESRMCVWRPKSVPSSDQARIITGGILGGRKWPVRVGLGSPPLA
jgi:Transaldolase/Fructose-6-phosphate aldolase